MKTRKDVLNSIKKTSMITILVFLIFYSFTPCYGNGINKFNYLPEHNKKNDFLYHNITDYSEYILINNNYISSSHEINGTSDKNEKEHPFRRFEITFFISAPFVFVITFASLHLYGAIMEKSTTVSVWKDYKPALLIGTFGISTGIAAREAWIISRENNKDTQETSTDHALYLYAIKNF